MAVARLPQNNGFRFVWAPVVLGVQYEGFLPHSQWQLCECQWTAADGINPYHGQLWRIVQLELSFGSRQHHSLAMSPVCEKFNTDVGTGKTCLWSGVWFASVPHFRCIDTDGLWSLFSSCGDDVSCVSMPAWIATCQLVASSGCIWFWIRGLLWVRIVGIVRPVISIGIRRPGQRMVEGGVKVFRNSDLDIEWTRVADRV